MIKQNEKHRNYKNVNKQIMMKNLIKMHPNVSYTYACLCEFWCNNSVTSRRKSLKIEFLIKHVMLSDTRMGNSEKIKRDHNSIDSQEA
jgi:SET domain-containing protein